jgi:hypothetical protein
MNHEEISNNLEDIRKELRIANFIKLAELTLARESGHNVPISSQDIQKLWREIAKYLIEAKHGSH